MSSQKYDWYQTDTKVTVAVKLKNYDKDSVKVSFEQKSISVSAKLLSGSEFILDVDLSESINTETSSYRLSPVKVELTLMKLTGSRWNTLESTEEKKDELPCPYNSVKDWGKVVQTITKEEEEEAKNLKGEESVDKLFKDIYSKADEATKRAMNKSYSLSGGTCLSTNWDEIQNQEMKVNPPDCMEYRKWN